MEPNKTSRRTFLFAAGIGAGAALMSKRARAQSSSQPLRVAFIGTGGIGESHIDGASRLGATCLCYAEVDAERTKKVKEKWPQAKHYFDYREMFDKQANDIDAVMVGTPDHHHYPATILAMQHGKHVYTQKPLTHTIWESRQLALAAQKYKVATQMGNQGHANEGNRMIVEYIRSGMIGDIREIHAWTDRPVWPQGLERPKGEDPIPEGFNWDVWLGPAPKRPFKKETYHPFDWRGWWDFGAGAIGDMACHTIDGIFWALGAKLPVAVAPVSSMPINNETFPAACSVRWEFAASPERPAFNMYWHEGGLRPPKPVELEGDLTLPDTGNIVLGTKASLLITGDYGDSVRVIPESKRKEIGKPPQMIERSPGHMEEWFAASRGEQPVDFPKSNFAYASALTEMALLGNLGARMQRRLEWDSANMKVTNLDEANQYISKEYREGWKFDI